LELSGTGQTAVDVSRNGWIVGISEQAHLGGARLNGCKATKQNGGFQESSASEPSGGVWKTNDPESFLQVSSGPLVDIEKGSARRWVAIYLGRHQGVILK